MNSEKVHAAQQAHLDKYRRERSSMKGTDPIRYRDLALFFKKHFQGKKLAERDPEMVMLYTATLVGMNLCMRYNELCRLWYVTHGVTSLHASIARHAIVMDVRDCGGPLNI